MNQEYLDNAISKNEKYQKKNKKEKYISLEILDIVERFIIEHKLVCYGGTAINNILPKDKQFYDYNIDIPDYDVFSDNAIKMTKMLSDILSYTDIYYIEAKSGFFFGTYKIFVNFVPLVDITQVNPSFYKKLLKDSITVDKIKYTSTEFLRMSLHQELARPMGDVSRWEKIYRRMDLLNKYYPVLIKKTTRQQPVLKSVPFANFKNIYNTIFNNFVSSKLVFCNINIIACTYKTHLSAQTKKNIICQKSLIGDKKYDPIIAYSNNLIETTEQLDSINELIEDYEVRYEYIPSIYKFIGDYINIYINNKYTGTVFETNSCLSHTTVKYLGSNINIGNIDTILNLYYSIILMDDMKIDTYNIKVFISQLYKIIVSYSKLIEKYKSIDDIPIRLKRFSLPCYGEQDNYQDILQTRYEKYREYKNKRSSPTYQKWFFKYSPIIKKDKQPFTKVLSKINKKYNHMNNNSTLKSVKNKTLTLKKNLSRNNKTIKKMK